MEDLDPVILDALQSKGIEISSMDELNKVVRLAELVALSAHHFGVDIFDDYNGPYYAMCKMCGARHNVPFENGKYNFDAAEAPGWFLHSSDCWYGLAMELKELRNV
jgi:hypothetical protein